MGRWPVEPSGGFLARLNKAYAVSLGRAGNPEGFSPDEVEFAESSPDSASEPLVAVIHSQDLKGSGGISDKLAIDSRLHSHNRAEHQLPW